MQTNHLTSRYTRNRTVDDLGAALVKLCGKSTLADILSVTLSADADERLSDYEVQIVSRLFDRISELVPDAVDMAMGKH
jgi:hypothetical protein